MADPSDIAAEMTTPYPPRFWWLKRLFVAAVVLLLILLALRLWWGHEADRRMKAAIAAAQARGEPVLITDFNDPAPPPDAQNAAALLKAAAASLVYTSEQRDFSDHFDPGVALNDSDRAMLAGLVAANIQAITLTRRAATQPVVNWDVRLSRPVISTITFSSASGQRELATFFRLASIYHHLAGDDAQTVEDLRDIFRIADALEHDLPFLITHLVVVGINGAAAEQVRRVAETLNIENSSLSANAQGATRNQVRTLIKRILDEKDYAFGAVRAYQGERMMAVDAASYARSITPDQSMPWILRPVFEMNGVQLFRFDSQAAVAAAEPNFPAAHGKLPFLYVRGDSPLRKVAHLFTAMLLPSTDRAIETHFRGLTERRTAAIFLAARLYEIDHGHLPARLEALVPDYLPAIPVDPFSPDHHALRYIGTPGAQAVYSVGVDEKDDGGSTRAAITLRSGRTVSIWNQVDYVFPWHAPALKPATTQGN